MTATAINSLDIAVNELDSLDAPAWNWDDFFKGVTTGLAIVAIAVT